MEYKILIELIPSCNWGINLRSVLKKTDWDIIRKKCYEKAGNKCEICGRKGKMHAHEKWEYNDEDHVQILNGIICLCEGCHGVKHFGRSQIIGKKEKCIDRMMEVNGWRRSEATQHIQEATLEWNKREGFEWEVDISFLEKYIK
jgi:hypothetical protein